METTYKLFGLIPLWSVKKKVADEDAMYDRMAKRFRTELNEEVQRQRRGK